MEDLTYDVIVVGTGHAGSEAALAAARLGCRTLAITINLDNVALMACNPSIGGPAKGHLVREIDALGGEMGRIADRSYLQVRLLNTSKGPAVQALRMQSDKKKYHLLMKEVLENTPNLELRQGEVERILVQGDRVRGVRLRGGLEIKAESVILTTGTFLNGRIFIGEVSYPSGPHGQHPAVLLSSSLRDLGFALVRFKTGTPPRLDGRSIDYEKMTIQPGDPLRYGFSYDAPLLPREQLPCWLTYTNERTHQLIRENLDRAPMFNGEITGIGPRYCPSIETKVVRFPHREAHQLFVEPEGEHTREMYLGGFSTSLPEEIQRAMVRTIPGLERAVIVRPGYAIEYDCLVPTQLQPSLELKEIQGLFAAGQINGTSGYEEAAAQGLIAGINAARKVKGLPPIILRRDEAYIGVLIDDLVTKGTPEPYRMLTSRAEYRLLLRQDNADLRLTELGWRIGLISEERYRHFEARRQAISREIQRLAETVVTPSPETDEFCEQMRTAPLHAPTSLADLLKRPELHYQDLVLLERRLRGALEGESSRKGEASGLSLEEGIIREVEAQIKYEGYIRREQAQVERFRRLEEKELPPELDYTRVPGLSAEAQEKLSRHRPLSLGQASRISGVSPADLAVLTIYLEQWRKKKEWVS